MHLIRCEIFKIPQLAAVLMSPAFSREDLVILTKIALLCKMLKIGDISIMMNELSLSTKQVLDLLSIQGKTVRVLELSYPETKELQTLAAIVRWAAPRIAQDNDYGYTVEEVCLMEW